MGKKKRLDIEKGRQKNKRQWWYKEPVYFKKQKIEKKKPKLTYKQYLNSKEWKAKRYKVLKRANYKCEICKINKAWQVHHKTYKNIFKEKLSDLEAVCGTCHRAEHDLLTDEEIEIAADKLFNRCL